MEVSDQLIKLRCQLHREKVLLNLSQLSLTIETIFVLIGRSNPGTSAASAKAWILLIFKSCNRANVDWQSLKKNIDSDSGFTCLGHIGQRKTHIWTQS